jgi:hypothetical protein
MVAVRPRRLSARALALTLAVGLCGMLVGLSIAATRMPGDTFQAKPRAVASTIDAGHLDDGAVAPCSGCESVLVAYLPLSSFLLLTSLLLVRARPRDRRWVAPALPVAGCRGPPQATR